MSVLVDAHATEPRGAPEAVGRARRWRRRLADDRGLADGVEHLFAATFLILLFLFMIVVLYINPQGLKEVVEA